MTKKKETQLELEEGFFANLAKAVGGDLLDNFDKVKGLMDTGILALNYAISGKFIGGGLPIGICAEVYGGQSSGKTLIGTNLLTGCQKANGIAVFLDAERTISKEFAVKASHVNPLKLIVVEADTLEKAFNKIFKVIRQARIEANIPMERPILIVYDSIASSPSEREFAETELDLETATKAQIKEAGAGADKPGERAKICSKELRKLTPYLQENNASVLFINQVRQKIGVMFGDPETGGGGGMALPFYCSTRMKMHSFKRIKDENGKVIGVNVTIKNTKNKISSPYREVVDLRLFFDKGIDPFGGLLEILKQAGRIEGAGPTYKIKEPWAGGKEIKFKSSKERNDVPSDVLLACPALVDGNSPEDVQYYINMFGSALDAVQNDVASEEDVTGEE